MFFTLLRIVYYSWDARNFLTLNSFHLFLCCFIFVLLISPHSLWLPVQPLSHSGVVLQAEEPSQGSAVTSTPGCPRWHSHRNSTGFPSPKQEQGMVSSVAEISMLIKMWNWLNMSDTSHGITPSGIYRQISSPKEKVPFSPGTCHSQAKQELSIVNTQWKEAHSSSLHWQKAQVWQRQGFVFSSQQRHWQLHCIPPQVWLCHSWVSLLGQPHRVLLGQSWVLHSPRTEVESTIPNEHRVTSLQCTSLAFKIPCLLPHANEEIFFFERPSPV